jgi:hypothetical protein
MWRLQNRRGICDCLSPAWRAFNAVAIRHTGIAPFCDQYEAPENQGGAKETPYLITALKWEKEEDPLSFKLYV